MFADDPTLLPLAFIGLGPLEMAAVAVIALLLFGSELPNVARTAGKHFNEFRRHLSTIRSELNDAIYAEPEPPRRLQHHPEYHRQADGTPETAALASPPTTSDAVVDVPAVEPPASATAASPD